MKRLFLALALLCGLASAQTTTTVTGVIKDLTQAVVTSGKVVYTLQPSRDSTISGLARFSPQSIVCPIAATGNVVSLANSNVTSTSGTTSPGTSVVVVSATGFAINQSIFIPGAGTPGTNGGNYIGTITNITGTTFTISPATVTSVNAGTAVYDPCQMTMTTALQPPGSFLKTDIWPYNVKTSSFTFYAVNAWYDWSTVVPTPTTSPAQNFVDVFSNQVIAGNKTWSGTQLFNGPVSFPGGVTGAVSFGGSVSFPGGVTGNNSFSGNNTFPGTTVACTLNGIEYIGGGCATAWGGGDLGAQANAAAAACPVAPSFCLIFVLGQGVTYAYSTPIVFSGSKPISFDLGGNTLNYTPTTGTVAINLNYSMSAVNGATQPHGVRNGLLQNNGCIAGNSCGGYTSSSSAVGIQLSTVSPANGAIGPELSNLVISGFNLGINVPTGNNVLWGSVIKNVQLSSNNAGLQCSSGGIYEAMQLYGVKFTVNKNGILNDCNGDIYMHGGDFDQNDNALNIEAGHTVIDGVHFEYNAPSSITAAVQTGGSLAISHSNFQDDNTTGNITNWFSCTAGELDWGPANHVFSGGRTATNVFNISSPCNFAAGVIVDDSPGALPVASMVGGTGTNNTYIINDGTAANTMLFGNGVVLKGTTVGNLPPVASYPGAIRFVIDSTAIASEGQTCAGSSTNKAIAISNGSVWKCF